MYSETIRPKVEQMFDELRTMAHGIVDSSKTAKAATERIGCIVESETSTQSEIILEDMLFELTNTLFDDPFFEDLARRNGFRKADLKQEILDKYRFQADVDINYQDAPRLVKALELGGAGLVGAALGKFGPVGVRAAIRFIWGRSLPAPSTQLSVSIVVAAALVGMLVEHCLVQPNRSKRKFKKAVDCYLEEAKRLFLLWFDEVEAYFYTRAGEIKAAL